MEKLLKILKSTGQINFATDNKQNISIEIKFEKCNIISLCGQITQQKTKQITKQITNIY